MSEALDRLQAEKEKAERELAQTQHKIQRLENLKGEQPLVRSGATENRPDTRVSGRFSLAERTIRGSPRIEVRPLSKGILSLFHPVKGFHVCIVVVQPPVTGSKDDFILRKHRVSLEQLCQGPSGCHAVQKPKCVR